MTTRIQILFSHLNFIIEGIPICNLTLLFQKCFRHTLRFYSEGSYDRSDSEGEQMVREIAEQCPLVFTKLFAASKDEKLDQNEIQAFLNEEPPSHQSDTNLDTKLHSNTRLWTLIVPQEIGVDLPT
jgi:hypothetical protein